MLETDENRLFAHEIVQYVLNLPNNGIYDSNQFSPPGVKRLFTLAHKGMVLEFYLRHFNQLRNAYLRDFASRNLTTSSFSLAIEDMIDIYWKREYSQDMFVNMCTHVTLWAIFARDENGLENAPMLAVNLIYEAAKHVTKYGDFQNPNF